MRVALLSPVFRWYSVRNRSRKAEQLDETVRNYGSATALVVGVGGNASAWEGIVERHLSDHAEVLATCDIAMKHVPWPFVQADGRFLPFRNDAVDIIVSNAVIEHVGDEEDQRKFVEEHMRVADVSFITTPNRWFPVESHTLVPLLHWSAKWRSGRKEFSRLLSLDEFRRLLPQGTRIVGRRLSGTFSAVVTRTTASDSNARDRG